MFSRLYIHVPFCVQKCHYCAFVSASPMMGELAEYPELLLQELQLHPPARGPLASIYFGGGTPSLLQPEQIAWLLAGIATLVGIQADAEITLEANPGTVTQESLRAFRAAGINRISLGIQSFDDRHLAQLGRVHTTEKARQAFLNARSAGFDTISIDLIHALPGQSLDQWRAELLQAINLSPEHISIYGLTVEEGTPFARTYPADSPLLADEDRGADMFELADELLTAAGFDHYEIANYARSGSRSRHNCGYWQRDGYLGLGVAAHTFFRDRYGVRFSNPDSLEEYRSMVASGVLVRRGEQRLAENDAMAEYMYLGLRLAKGINPDCFAREFGRSLESVYGAAIEELSRFGLLTVNGQTLSLTLRGMLLSNQVFARFI